MKNNNIQMQMQQYHPLDSSHSVVIPVGSPIQNNLNDEQQLQQNQISDYQYPQQDSFIHQQQQQQNYAMQQPQILYHQQLQLQQPLPQMINQQQNLQAIGVMQNNNNNQPALMQTNAQQYIFCQQTLPINFVPNSVPQTRVSENLFCKTCLRVVPSLVEYKPGKGAYLSGLLIGLLGCWAGCCLIPCCNEDFQDAKHSCTLCGTEIGKRNFIFN